MPDGGGRTVSAQVYDGGVDVTDAVYGSIQWRTMPASVITSVSRATLSITAPSDWDRDEQPVVIDAVYGDSSSRQVIWAARSIPLIKALNSRKAVQEPSGKLSDDDIIAIAAAGEDPSGPLWQKSGNDPISWRANNTADLTTTGKKAKLLLALALAKSVALPGTTAAGLNLTDFGAAHLNLVNDLAAAQSLGAGATEGHIGTDLWEHCLAVLALKAAEDQGAAMPGGYDKAKAKGWLLGTQTADGSWAWDGGGTGTDPDSTALALRALAALGETDKSAGTPLKKGLDYLKARQNSDGGFSNAWAPGSSGDTTAGALLALAATGENPTGEAWKNGGNSGVDYLLAIQQADGSWDPSKVFTPGDVIAALAKSAPLGRSLQSRKAVQEPTGKLSDDDIIAIATVGEDPSAALWQKSGNDPVSYRANNTDDLTTTGKKAKLLMALALAKSVALPGSTAAGVNLTDFGVAHLNLVNDLAAAQSLAAGATEGHIGTDLWEHCLAVLALKAAEDQGAAMPGGYDKAKAKGWLLRTQTADGSWAWDGGAWTDPDSTALALRALAALGETDKSAGTPLKKGLDYLKARQNSDGGFSNAWAPGSSGDTTAGVLLALAATGENPTGEAWKNGGKSGVDYLLAIQQADGSWDPADVFTPGDVIAALAKSGMSRKSLVFVPAGTGGSGAGPVNGQIQVIVRVTGKNGETLYPRTTLSFNPGATALDALYATGLSITLQGSDYVLGINGVNGEGIEGWKFSVNGTEPGTSSRYVILQNGDNVYWYWGNANTTGPQASSNIISNIIKETITLENLPQYLQPSPEALTNLDILTQLPGLNQATTELGSLGEAVKAVFVVGIEKLPARAEAIKIKNELSENIVGLSQKVEAANGAAIADKLGEIGLVIPADALKQDVTITIKEITAASPAGNQGGNGALPAANFQQASPVYSFGPDGTVFTSPVTLILKVVLPPLTSPDNLALAWYDRSKGKWNVIPAVFDAGKGLIIAKIQHFTDFAVLARQSKKSFEDVASPAYTWAQEPVELLAGAGVINGIDGRNYDPDRAITRAELTGILVKALNLPAATGGATFKDVTGNEWYSACVAAASQAGLVAGYEDGTFRPDKTITREEMVAVLARALDLATPSGAAPYFTDEEKVSFWARDSVAAAVSGGLIKGYPDGTFQPQGTATRAECAVMVYHALANQ